MQRFEKHVFLKQPTMGGPPTWGLGEGLKLKRDVKLNQEVYRDKTPFKSHHFERDFLVQLHKQVYQILPSFHKQFL
jgi:hypothetical protein